jgi:DNA-binding NarL/FixJ family response regulator
VVYAKFTVSGRKKIKGEKMLGKTIIIATNAGFLGTILQDKLREIGLQSIVAASDNDLMSAMEKTRSRLIFMENCFHGQGTEEYVLRVMKHGHGLRMVIWSAYTLAPIIACRFLSAGANSFFTLRESKETIMLILHRIAVGENYYPNEVAKIIERGTYFPVLDAELTIREIEIIKLSINERTNGVIARLLGIKPTTVKFHKTNVYRKCGGNTTIHLLRYGLSKGIICLDDLILGEGGE